MTYMNVGERAVSELRTTAVRRPQALHGHQTATLEAPVRLLASRGPHDHAVADPLPAAKYRGARPANGPTILVRRQHSRLNRIECVCNTGLVPPKISAVNFRGRYVHRLRVFPQDVSRVTAGQRHRYSQASSRSHSVVHRCKASVHIAIHKMPRVLCHWSRHLALAPARRIRLMKAEIPSV
jgi:hypothetical protein